MKNSTPELRQAFIRYFERMAIRRASSALIPQADPTLLFTNAGMNQFKRVFLGEETRAYKRAVTVQKCLRAGASTTIWRMSAIPDVTIRSLKCWGTFPSATTQGRRHPV